MTKRQRIAASLTLAVCLPVSLASAQWDSSATPFPDQAQTS